MKPQYYPPRKNWVIYVPHDLSESGKPVRKFFPNEHEAAIEVARIKRRGSTSVPKVTEHEEAALILAKKLGLSEHEILKAVEHYQKTVLSIGKPNATLEEACVAYMNWHVSEKHNRRTIYKYRSTLRRLCESLNGDLPVIELTADKLINGFLKRWGPGTTRLSQQRNVQAFLAWASHKANGYLSTNPLEGIETKDSWESNKEILPVEDFRRILFTCAQKFPRLLPYFVLGGLAGVRRCEMISSTSAENDPRIEWTDIDFKLNKIRIRDNVAKQTNAADRRRSIPLEPAAKEWLQLVAKTEGPVIAISQSQLQRDKAELLDLLKLKVPENALRNSYASYGCAFRSIGDVARAMGDLEVTIKRYYVDLVDDPELGRAWFDIRPGGERKIVPMKEVA